MLHTSQDESYKQDTIRGSPSRTMSYESRPSAIRAWYQPESVGHFKVELL
jgi:hypothetical protein